MAMHRQIPDGKDNKESVSGSDSIPELEEALANLSQESVEERRKRMFSMSRYSYEMGSDGFDSPGSSIFGKPGFNFLPYGVHSPSADSLMSTGSREMMSGSYMGYGSGWKLPDKLRIIKPLEGSLTLHQWQRLAKPSLEGIFEERKGVVMRGSRANNLTITEEDQISDLEDESDIGARLKAGAARLQQQTLTNSNILHPDLTEVTNSYPTSGSRMSTSLLSSRRSSMASSMVGSIDDLRMDFGTSTFSTNLGLSYVLNERNIHGGSNMSLDRFSNISRTGSMSDFSKIRTGSASDIGSISSLTPSVIHSPTKGQSFSPTGTPLNSPEHSRPHSPTRKNSPPTMEDNPGYVLGFFASLRTALYGEQQKEVMTLKKKARKSKKGQKKLGILEKVQEVGPERFLSPAPLEEESEVEDCEVQPLNQDWDELIDIKPGTLTVSRGMRATRHESDLFGELKPPDASDKSGRGPGRILSPGDKRPSLPSAYGVPGKTGTDALQRRDLGSIPGADFRLVSNAERLQIKPDNSHQDENSFIGSLTTMFFGRKGGLL